MKIKISLIVALFTISCISKAQTSEDTFKKGVDYVNCKTIELSLKSDTANYKKYLKECPCKKATYTKIYKFLTSMTPLLEVTISLSAEIERIKNKFDEKKTSDEIIQYLSETILNDKGISQQLFVFAEKRRGDASLSKFKSDLKKNLSRILSTQSIPIVEPQPNAGLVPHQSVTVTAQNDSLGVVQTNSDLEAKLSVLENKLNHLDSDKGTRSNEEKKGWFDGFPIQIDILTLIISLILTLTILKTFKGRLNREDEVSNKLKNYIADKISRIQFNSNSNSGISTNEFRKLKDDIESLKSEIKQLKMNPPFEVIQQNNEQKSFQENKQADVKTQAETFFLSAPNPDGSFNESSASSTYKDGASIYKFTKVGNNKAKFQIDEREASIKLALQYPGQLIDPVCDPLNAFNPKAKRIITDSLGEAELVHDKWIRNTKAKIKYE